MAAKTTYELEVLLGASTSSNYYRSLNSAADSLQNLNRTASTVATAITAAFAAVNITRFVEDAVETYTGFEQEMATVASISGATASQYAQMEDAALSAGRATIYTAAESASALEYMSLAGWDVDTSVTALLPVLKMAAATGAELGTTSDLVTDSMSALEIEVDELDSYLNKMIATNNNANTTAEDLMSALIKTGGASRALGADLDDTITSLGILANNGVKGEEAGTALNAILTRISANTTALSELDKIGVSIFDDTGSFIGLEESLTAINDAMADFSDEQRAQSLKNIAGTQRYTLMKYLLDSVTESVETGTSAWDKLEEKVDSSTGALSTMYNTTTDTLENALAIFESAQDDMKIRLVDVFSDDAKEFIRWMADELPEATDSLVAFAETHRGDFADALETAGEAIETVWDVGVTAGTWLIDHRGVVVGSLTAIGTALATLKVINTGASLFGFLTSITTNPLVWGATSVAATAGAITGAIVGIGEAIEQAEEKAKAANLEEHFGQISLSLEEIDTLARQIVGEDSLNGVTAMLEAAGGTADSLGNITEIWSELQKEDWKLNAGFNFDTENSKTYTSQVESYIRGVEQYIENKGYEVHIATSLLFGEGSKQDVEVGDFFAEVESTLAQYEATLSEDITKAMEDGIIGWDENKVIQESIAKINNITSALSEAEAQAKFDVLDLKYDGTDMNPESFAQLQKDLGEYEAEVAEGAQSAYYSAMTMYQYKLDNDPGYTQDMFDTDKQGALDAYHKTVSDAASNSINYMMDSIYEAYPELQEFEQQREQYQSDVNDILNKYSDPNDIDLRNDWATNPNLMLQNMYAEAYDALPDISISEDSKNALNELLSSMAPTAYQISELKKEGGELSEEAENALQSWQSLYTLVSDDEGLAALDITDAISADGTFQSFLDDIGLEIDETHATVQKKLEDTYQDGFDVSTNLRVKFDLSASGLPANSSSVLNSAMINAPNNFKIASNAQGGIYDKPILTMFAEEGPEAAVPLDGSDRAKSLWLQAGQILGMFQGGTSRDKALYNAVSSSPAGGSGPADNIQIVYSNNITIQGNASKEEVQSAVSIGINELRPILEEIIAEKQRTSFKGRI